MKLLLQKIRQQAEIIFVVVVSVALWLIHSAESLWLDELQTTWVIQGSYKFLIDKVFDTQGFTPFYYSIIWALQPYISASEQLLRLPSLIFILLAALVLYQCALQLMSKTAAVLSILIFVSLDEVVESSLHARPYALALSFSVFALWFLMRWARSARRLDLYLYIICFVLSVYAHFLFAGVIVLHLAYMIIKRATLQCTARQYFLVGFYIAVGMVPLVPQVRLMLQKKELMAIASNPRLFDLVLGSIPLISLIPIVLSFFLALCCLRIEERVFRRSKQLDLPILVWLIAYTIIPPCLLYLLSIYLSTSLFIPRYYLWFAPGFALLCGYSSDYLQNHRMRELLLVVIAVVTISFEFTKQRMHEDWRAAVTALNNLDRVPGAEPATLLLYSGVVESSNPAWLMLSLKQGQFSSPLSYYQTKATPILIPLLAMDNLEIDGFWQVNIVPQLVNVKILNLLCLNNLSWLDASGRQVVCDVIDREIKKLGFIASQERKFKRVSLIEYNSKAVLN